MKMNCFSPKIWENGIQEETLCFYTDVGGTVHGGRLLHDPGRILSVISYGGTVQYEQGVDYCIDKSGISRCGNSRIPIMLAEEYCPEFKGEDQYRWLMLTDDVHYVRPYGKIRDYQIKVCYEPKSVDFGFIPRSQVFRLPKTIRRLRDRKLRIAFYGDSITVGCDASGRNDLAVDVNTLEDKPERTDFPPYQPSWAQLVTDGLSTSFDADVSKANRAACGATAAWGAENAELLLRDYPADLYVIGFGMNHMCGSAERYRSDIFAVVSAVRSWRPDCEILLVSPMTANFDIASFQNNNMAAYEHALEEICMENKGIALAPVHSVFREISKRKDYLSLSGNCVNHPNDYAVRIYAQTLLSCFGI